MRWQSSGSTVKQHPGKKQIENNKIAASWRRVSKKYSLNPRSRRWTTNSGNSKIRSQNNPSTSISRSSLDNTDELICLSWRRLPERHRFLAEKNSPAMEAYRAAIQHASSESFASASAGDDIQLPNLRFGSSCLIVPIAHTGS
jgi:hypothetical protein